MTMQMWEEQDQGDGSLLLISPDQERGLVIKIDDEEGSAEAQLVYPCRRCDWLQSCGPNGEECHS